MTLTVLATDRLSFEGLAPLRDDERFEVRVLDDSSSPGFFEALGEAEGLIVRSATKVDARLLDEAPRLRVIGRAGVGVDNIDMEAASERGIAVFNAPEGNTVAAAEMTMAVLLATMRKVAAADRSIRAGRWDRSAFRGVELRGKTLGLVGAGRIGREVARRCRAFGMEVIAFDPYLAEEAAEALGIQLVSFDRLIEEADVISLHVPLTDETRGLIDAEVLRRMKKGSFLVNVSRGGVIDEEALARTLGEGSIAGAALDVYAVEPLPSESPLREAPNLVLTPHLGASTHEAQVEVAREVAIKVKSALLHGELGEALNAESLG
ncbi:MAG: hydroxyacid dehydrogenase [Acidimicrobiia bacterium]